MGGALLSGATGRPLFEQLEQRLLLDGVAESQAIELFNLSPALFVENQGQWADESIRYAFQGSGVNVLFTDAGPILELYRSETLEDAPDGELLDDPFALPHERSPAEDIVTELTRVSLRFDGANAAVPVGLGEAETKFNYFVGDESNWRSNVSSYQIGARSGGDDGRVALGYFDESFLFCQLWLNIRLAGDGFLG